jgi:hypothetical protein
MLSILFFRAYQYFAAEQVSDGLADPAPARSSDVRGQIRIIDSENREDRNRHGRAMGEVDQGNDEISVSGCESSVCWGRNHLGQGKVEPPNMV